MYDASKGQVTLVAVHRYVMVHQFDEKHVDLLQYESPKDSLHSLPCNQIARPCFLFAVPVDALADAATIYSRRLSIVPHQRSEACNPKAFKPLNGILLNPVQKQEHYSDLEVVSDRAHQAPELDLRHQPDKEAAFADEKQYAAPATPQQRICGMRKSIAYSLFAIIGLLIVGAVVGGAVGGTQASSHKNSSPTSSSTSAVSDTTSTSLSTPATTSTTATTSTVSTASPSATPIGPGEGTYTCPQSNNEDYTTSSGTGSLTFRQLCDVDWPVGVTALAGSATDTVEDLSTVLEYSLEQCIEQCAVYSINNSPGCMAVTYGANVTLAQGRGIGGNCFLKSARGASNLADDSGQAQSAYLITG